MPTYAHAIPKQHLGELQGACFYNLLWQQAAASKSHTVEWRSSERDPCTSLDVGLPVSEIPAHSWQLERDLDQGFGKMDLDTYSMFLRRIERGFCLK